MLTHHVIDGDIDDRVRAVIRAVGLEPIIWNRDTLDWMFQNYNGVIRGASPGPPKIVDDIWVAQTPQQIPDLFKIWVSEANFTTSVISLQHDLYEFSAKEVPASLDNLMNTRFTVVDVLQCLKMANPYNDDILIKAKMPLTFLDPPPANMDSSSGRDPSQPGYYYYGNSGYIQLPSILLAIACILLVLV